MKNIKRFLAVILASVFVLVMASCEKTKTGYKSYTEQVGAIKFLNTDWGMSYDETMKALEDKNIKFYQFSDSKYYYESVKKIEVNGLQATVRLYFENKLSQAVLNLDNNKEIDNAVGLYQVVLLFKEDEETVYKAFEKELGDNPTPIELVGDNQPKGYVNYVVKYKDVKDDSIKKEIDKIIKGSGYEQNKNELPINTFEIERDIFGENDPLYSTAVTYSSGILALLNNEGRTDIDVSAKEK